MDIEREAIKPEKFFKPSEESLRIKTNSQHGGEHGKPKNIKKIN